MTAQTYIDKLAPLKKSEDYHLLRKLGISHIENMASKLWTDYNVHDPGITTLEMLCYAITDLGLRTAYPVEDILAEKTPQGHEDIKNFFSARTILPVNPVTAGDFRGLMIDVPGVKNAWLEIVDFVQPQIYDDCAPSELTLTPEFKVSAKALKRLDKPEIPAEVYQKLLTLQSIKYPDLEAFVFALDELLGLPTATRYRRDILVACAWMGPQRRVEPVDLQGLYDVVLELEVDSELGDLNRFIYEARIEDANQSFKIEVVLPPWDLLFNQCLDPPDMQDLKFSNLTYNSQHRFYEGDLKVIMTAGDPAPSKFRVVSQGPKTTANRELIKNWLDSPATILAWYRDRLARAFETVKSVYARIHAHRNLCEDFYRFKAIAIDDIAVCADLEVTAEADLEKVLGEVYYQIGQFLAPVVHFYSIKELMAKGLTADKIFEGPILQHGFLDYTELQASEFVETIRVSDIIQIIMDIEGVVAVKNILLTNFTDGVPQTSGEPWSLDIQAGRAVRLDVQRSKFVFYKGIIPYGVDEEKARAKAAQRQARDRYARLNIEAWDLDVPEGSSRNIRRYFSIQNDFPLCYGIGPEGLAPSVTALRKAQAKQYKAYLLLFDQLLADYLAQLSHLKDVFTLNADIKKTYFSQLLHRIDDVSESDVPGLPPLIKKFVESLLSELDPDNPSDYRKKYGETLKILDNPAGYRSEYETALQEIKTQYLDGIHQREDLMENQATYEDRKNRILDHLMSRFAESFTDYVTLMYTLDRKKAPRELIEDKLAFLQDYPVISRDRGKAFNYKNVEGPARSANVSGLQKRVSRLLGIRSYEQQIRSTCIDLAFEIYPEKDQDDIDEYRFRLRDDQSQVLLSSTRRFKTELDCEEAIEKVVRFGPHKENYRPVTAEDGRFYFHLVDDQDRIIAHRIEGFDTANKRDKAIETVADFMSGRPDCEGFYLVEHILLRPQDLDGLKAEDDSLLAVCVPETCETCSGWLDPYSFRVTAVIPAWPKRFRNMDFRRFVETTLRQEAPAHVHIKICWVDRKSMQAFGQAYEAWLEEIGRAHPDAENYYPVQKKLIAALASLRSVYTETRLHECVEGESIQPLLLNHSILGTTQKDQ